MGIEGKKDWLLNGLKRGGSRSCLYADEAECSDTYTENHWPDWYGIRGVLFHAPQNEKETEYGGAQAAQKHADNPNHKCTIFFHGRDPLSVVLEKTSVVLWVVVKQKRCQSKVQIKLLRR